MPNLRNTHKTQIVTALTGLTAGGITVPVFDKIATSESGLFIFVTSGSIEIADNTNQEYLDNYFYNINLAVRVNDLYSVDQYQEDAMDELEMAVLGVLKSNSFRDNSAWLDAYVVGTSDPAPTQMPNNELLTLKTIRVRIQTDLTLRT